MLALVPDSHLASLEEFVLSSNRREVLERRFVPGSDAYGILKGLVEFWDGNTEVAETALQQEEKGSLAKSLECLIKLKGWEEGDVGRKELQRYLTKLLELDFDVDKGHTLPTSPQQQPLPSPSQPLGIGIDDTLLDPMRILDQLEKAVDDCEQMANFALLERSATSMDTRLKILEKTEWEGALPDVVSLLAALASTPEKLDTALRHAEGLTTAQLLELGRRSPRIAQSPGWVCGVVKTMYPNTLRTSFDKERSFLKSVEDFADSLPTAHSWLKHRVLNTKVAAMVENRSVDIPTFVEFLESMKRMDKTSDDLVFDADLGPRIPNSNRDIIPLALGIVAGGDEGGSPLFEAENGLSKLLEAESSRKIVAEGMLLRGETDSQAKWAEMYTRAGGDLQALQTRVDLDLLSSNKKEWTVGEKVALELAVKNVPNMIVKIFEIDTWNFACANGKDVDINVDLEGLGPAIQESFKFDHHPMHSSTFKYECLEGRRGAFVLEFVGGGKIARVLVKKGGIHWMERVFHGGHAFRVMYEDNSVMEDAKIWMDGQTFEMEPDSSEVIIPFCPTTGSRQVVIGNPDGIAVCASIQLKKERYSLSGMIHLDPEANVPHEWASLLIQASLSVCGKLAPIHLLEDVSLEISTTDADGVENLQHIKGFKISDDKMTIQRIRLPDRCTSLNAQLKGRVQKKTQVSYQGESSYQEVKLEENQKFNSTLASSEIRDMFLARDGSGNFVVRVLGSLSLGRLEGVTKIEAALNDGIQKRVWNLSRIRGLCSSMATPINIEWKEGEDVFILYQEDDVFLCSTDKGFRLYSINELGKNSEDLSELLSYTPGYICAKDLAPGRYMLLTLSTGHRSMLNIVKADRTLKLGTETVMANQDLHSEAAVRKPIQITSLECSASEGLVLHLGGEESDITNARILVAFKRFVSDEISLKEREGGSRVPLAPGDFSGLAEWDRIQSGYSSTKRLSNESRYVMERREHMSNSNVVGNMLPKPSLLINPFRTKETETSVINAEENGRAPGYAQQLQENIAHNASAIRHPVERSGNFLGAPLNEGWRCFGRGLGPRCAKSRIETLEIVEEVSHLFCPSSATFVVGGGGTGVVQLSLEDLVKYGMGDLSTSGHTHVCVMAVAPSGCKALDSTFVARDGSGFDGEPLRDMGLKRGIDDRACYVEGREITYLTCGESMTIPDASFGKFRVLSSVADIWRVYLTIMGSSSLLPNPQHLDSGASVKDTLLEFSFILNWPNLSNQEKLEHLTANACHELHFFIKQRDPDFFNQFVLPILKNKNKNEMDFMDEYLIDAEDLVSKWTIPSRFNRLDLAESCLLIAKLSPEKAVQYGKDIQDMSSAQSVKHRENAKWRKIFSIALASGVVDEEQDFVEECEEADESSGDDLRQAFCALESPPVQYHQAQKAQEWIETGYWKSKKDHMFMPKNSCGDFWADFVTHCSTGKNEFLTKYLLGACQTFTEAIFALSLCGLPIQASPDGVKLTSDGPSVTIASTTPSLVCHKQMKPAQPPNKNQSTVVSLQQHIFDPQHPTEIDPETGEKIERIITTTLRAGKRYSYRAVITNSTGSVHNLDVLMHVPEGSLSLGGKPSTVSLSVQLGSYHCQKLEWEFYFPGEGVFSQYAMTVSKGDKLLATTTMEDKLRVEKDPEDVRPIESLSWKEFSKRASDGEVLEYLKRGNLAKADLLDLFPRFKQREFYTQARDILRERHHYDDTVWCWSVFHLDDSGLKEFLPNQKSLVDVLGPVKTELMDVSARDCGYRHLEYWPLINARTHKLKGSWSLANKSLKEQWRTFIEMAIRFPKLDPSQVIEAAHYLLAQDRLEDASTLLQRMDSELQGTEQEPEMAMQVDLMKAWLDISNPESDLLTAHEVSRRYSGIGHGKWSQWFKMLTETLEEIEQGAGEWELVDEQASKDSAPVLQIIADDAKGDILVDYRNISSIDIKIYPMDVELLFSSSPFTLLSGSTQGKETDDLGQFAAIKPYQTKTVELHETEGQHNFSLQEYFPESGSASVMVCVTGDTLQRTLIRYGNDLRIRVMEKLGLLFVGVASDGVPAAGAYIKVFARKKGSAAVVFHKDGYTDRRGKFDFATLSSHGVENVEKFAILVSTKNHGCLTLGAKPPAH
ncbi:hypothetical protein BSKO_04456 [Bryopsis sp. KO-2023]|nr:hypothetical protein BSKO_04456 [Bryopsis sp. KO-2023]